MQTVITICIVLVAVWITGRKLYLTFASIETEESPCTKCSSSCNGCELKDLKNQSPKNKIKK